MEFESILPLRAILFQVLFMVVSIALEAIILRQRLRLAFKPSVEYAFATNLATVVAGWLAFLIIEPLISAAGRAQLIGYIFYNELFPAGWSTSDGAILFAVGLVTFFAAFVIKRYGIEYFLRADNKWKSIEGATNPDKKTSRGIRYARARGGRVAVDRTENAGFADAILQANAVSFAAILLLILLRTAL